MKYNNYILLGIAFTALPVSIQAQTQPKDTTVNRTVIVEQQYNPDIMDAAKVNVLPKVEDSSRVMFAWDMAITVTWTF